MSSDRHAVIPSRGGIVALVGAAMTVIIAVMAAIDWLLFGAAP